MQHIIMISLRSQGFTQEHFSKADDLCHERVNASPSFERQSLDFTESKSQSQNPLDLLFQPYRQFPTQHVFDV